MFDAPPIDTGALPPHLYSQALNAAPVALLVADAGGTIVFANRHLEHLFRYPAGALQGRAVEALLPERLRAAHIAYRESFLCVTSNRRFPDRRGLVGLCRDGAEIPVEISLNAVEFGGRLHALCSIVDLSHRERGPAAVLRASGKGLESPAARDVAALARPGEDAQEADEHFRQIAHAASHELQAPLRGIVGSAQMLARMYLPGVGEEGQQVAWHLLKSTADLQALLRGLAEYVGVDQEARPLQPLRLGELLGDALLHLEPAVADAGIVLGDAPPAAVLGDRVQLIRLLVSLIDNAVKFRGGGRPGVHVEVRDLGQEILVSVRDHGIGIAAEHHAEVFDLFRRLHAPAAYPGTGTGLALCRRIVGRHGGRIWLESEIGAGCTVLFTLRKAAQTPARPVHPAHGGSPESS